MSASRLNLRTGEYTYVSERAELKKQAFSVGIMAGVLLLLAIVFSLVTAVVSLMLLPLVSAQVVLSLPAGKYFGDFTFVLDGLSVFLAIIAAGIGALAVIFSVNYMDGEAQLGRYYALLLFFVGAMIGLVSAFFLVRKSAAPV